MVNIENAQLEIIVELRLLCILKIENSYNPIWKFVDLVKIKKLNIYLLYKRNTV